MNLKQKSIKILKSLQLKNGGILATPLNGAYPYVYTRDGVIITKALNSVGLTKHSERFYYFMRKFAKLRDYGEVFQRYNDNGWPCVTRKNENDNEGLLLHGIYDTFLHNKDESFIQNMWLLVEETVKLILSYLRSGLLRTERSIHEFYRLEHGYEIWSNCAGWRGLKDAAEIAKLLNHKKQAEKWGNKADELKKNINKKLFNKKLGFYMKNIRYPKAPDMSQLAPFYFGLSNSKKILMETLQYLRKHIWNSELGGFRRFRKFGICEDWHWYTGGSGSWIPLTCWAARFYKQVGDKKNYNLCLNWVEDVASKSNGSFPEHIAVKEEYDDWKRNEIEFNRRIINATKKAEKNVRNFKGKKVVYWANPLGWSHAEYLLLKK